MAEVYLSMVDLLYIIDSIQKDCIYYGTTRFSDIIQKDSILKELYEKRHIQGVNIVSKLEIIRSQPKIIIKII